MRDALPCACPVCRPSTYTRGFARQAPEEGADSRGCLKGRRGTGRFQKNDERDAYVLGGLWSTIARPPLALPTDFIIKRVIKTGKAAGFGHEIEFDDLLQSITITSSTQQKVTIDPTMIELSTTGGSVSLKLDLISQTVSITAPLKIELQAPRSVFRVRKSI